MSAALLLALTVSGCARPATGVNAATPQTEDRIEAALATGDVPFALEIARDYERRVPGPEAWSYMGRSLWRLGDLNGGEAFHRRSAGDGHPEGRLGLARAAAARGELEEALALAEPTIEVESMATRAAAFVGGVQWRLGRPAEAAESFERGADANDPVRGEELRQWAAAMRSIAGAAPGWRGEASDASTVLEAGVTWVEATVGGQRARMRFDPLASRSTITPSLAQRAGTDPAVGVVALPVEIASVAATLPLEIAEAAEGDGVLGFDALVGLRWIWTPADGAVFVGPADSAQEDPLFQRDLARTHWVAARTVLDGLEAQLLIVPRLGARPVVASLALEGGNTVSLAAAQRADDEADLAVGQSTTLLTRVGGWSAELEYEISHPCAALCQVPTVTPVILGADFLAPWSWRWSPDDRQLAMIRRD